MMMERRTRGGFGGLYTSNRTRGVVFFIANNNKYKLDRTPVARHQLAPTMVACTAPHFGKTKPTGTPQ
jgi:hypothetical protein